MPQFVIKSSKEKEPYNKEKVINSLKRINLSEDKIDEILFEIDKKLPETISTKKLFEFIFNYLKKFEENHYYKFNLKQAIFKLGPTGYPFEKFIAHLFKLYGYQASHNIFLNGKCLSYEIDVLIENKDVVYVGECKYHQVNWARNDLKVALYCYARFLDLKEANYLNKNFLPLIITNTRFTTEAIKFCNCYNISFISWKEPENNNLVSLIENKLGYPLTVFDFLPLRALQFFFQYDIVLVSDVLNKDKGYLKKISGLSENDIDKLIRSSSLLYNKSF